VEDIYNRLDSGADGAQSTFTEPGVAPGTGTMHTLNETMAEAPARDDTNGAVTGDVATGKTFWGLNVTGGEWGLRTGTANVCASPAGVPKTGQTTCYDVDGNVRDCAGTGEDGDLLKGVAWPNPRFTKHGDGTVTDNLTGLIWLQNANCAATSREWQTALDDVAQLNSDGTMNTNDCGDTSNGGAHQTDWRMPNMREQYSLVHLGFTGRAVPNTAGTGKWTTGDPFDNVDSGYYWSSTTRVDDTDNAWCVRLNHGSLGDFSKDGTNYLWPVRDGQ